MIKGLLPFLVLLCSVIEGRAQMTNLTFDQVKEIMKTTPQPDSYASAALPSLTLEKAREILKTTRPDRFAKEAAAVIKSPENLNKQKIYDDQWTAILRLAADPKLVDAEDLKLLIPYLSYGGGWGSISLGQPDLDQTKQCIPAFRAILENPAAKEVLSNYCLDPKNQTQDRLTAFLVLRYANLKEFKKITSQINDQFANSSQNVKQYLMAVENNSAYFTGDTPPSK